MSQRQDVQSWTNEATRRAERLEATRSKQYGNIETHKRCETPISCEKFGYKNMS